MTVAPDGKVSGTMSMNGQDHPINGDAGGPLFADGPGSYQQLARLPLADGYTATYRNFDVQKQKAKLMKLTVAGTESIEVLAGTFDTFKVDLAPADGAGGKTTLWVAKDTRVLVKVSAVLAEMSVATLVAELIPQPDEMLTIRPQPAHEASIRLSRR